MAKVTMPLLSGSASGKIANAMVFFPWKGVAVVRKWLRPSNPETANQGDARLVLGGLGKSTRAIEINSLYRNDAKIVAPSGQTWVSALVQYLTVNFMIDAAAFEAQETEFQAHAQKAVFTSTAAEVLLTDFDISYKGTTSLFSKGLQLYMIAKYGIGKRGVVEGAFERTPYTVAIANWSAGNIQSLKDDLTTIV